YLDARDVIPDHFDLKLGRTYVPQSAITSTVDGGYVNARNLGLRGLGLTAFGGHKVTYDNLAEVGNADDLAAGGSVYVDLVRRTHLEASYARKWIGGDYAQDFASLDVNTVPFAFLGLTGRAKYDLGESRWAELLAGVSLTPFDPLEIPLVIKGEVIVERPSFDQFSFYRYFGVARYQEFGGALEYEVLEGLRLNARYAYENFAGANDDVDQHANVIEAGASFRRVRNLVVNASFLNRNGFGARLSGLRLNAAYALGKLGLLAGIDYDDFRRDLARTDTSKRYWAGANYEINKNFTVSVHGEDDISYLFTHTLQGVAALVFHL
ncbi:MAG TPA: hypothetical protein VMK66_15945, partial [Myxococcales bacterium]|nr:hypothetical protein [Myxococcales bacterium]